MRLYECLSFTFYNLFIVGYGLIFCDTIIQSMNYAGLGMTSNHIQEVAVVLLANGGAAAVLLIVEVRYFVQKKVST